MTHSNELDKTLFGQWVAAHTIGNPGIDQLPHLIFPRYFNSHSLFSKSFLPTIFVLAAFCLSTCPMLKFINVSLFF